MKYDVLSNEHYVYNAVCVCPKCFVGYMIYLSIKQRTYEDLQMTERGMLHVCDTCGYKACIEDIFDEYDVSRYENETLNRLMAEEELRNKKKITKWITRLLTLMRTLWIRCSRMKKNYT